MIEHARAATSDDGVEYEVLDASDQGSLDRLPTNGFDAAVSTMVLMDMVDTGPFLRSLPRFLASGGAFVFATAHPCFNSPHAHLESEGPNREGGAPAAVRVDAYRMPSCSRDMAMRGQPVKTPFFHRAISDLLRPVFSAGLVLDALEEACFPPDHDSGRRNSWGGRFSEFPAVLAGRFRNGTAE